MTDNDRGQVATAAAQIYEEFFVPALFGAWPETILDAAEVGPGHHVLDVACGTGVLAREALARVGTIGRVVGLDPNEGMLGVAREKESAIDWRKGVAEAIPFETDVFDRVVSQFGMMFFTNPKGAIEEMARVMTPGGTMALAVWSSLEDTPGYAAMVQLLDDIVGREAADALSAPYVMGNPEALEALVAHVFPDVTVTRHEGIARFDSIDAWVHTDIRGWTLSEMIDDEQYAALLAEARRRLGRFTDETGCVTFSAPALVATAGSLMQFP